MANGISVKIIEARSQVDPPATHLAYVVTNGGQDTTWLVDDGWLIWKQSGNQIELAYVRGRMQPGSHPFGYFVPEVVEVAAGTQVRREVELTWPQRLSGLWNSERVAKPEPGLYQVRVRIGYGLTPEASPPTLGESVEAPVLRWQHEAISPSVEIIVPEYQV